MYRVLCIIVGLIGGYLIPGIGQIAHDAHFVMGYWSDGPSGYKDPIIKFRSDSVVVRYDSLAIGMDIASGAISDREGRLLFYINGCDVANAAHQIMEGGAGLNAGPVATRNCGSNNGYTSGNQSMLILPMDEEDQEYIIFHNTKEFYFEGDTVIFYGKPQYTVVDMTANNGLGRVTLKNHIYMADTTVCGDNLTAVRHANNKDWWIIVMDQDGGDNFYRVLLRDGAVSVEGQQRIGYPRIRTYEGQAGFSSDGRRYFRYSGRDGLTVMDFDRETGLFSHVRHMPDRPVGFIQSASFSPNGKYVYIGNGRSLVQVDIEADPFEVDTVAIWDGTTATWGQPAYFGPMQIGMDCRIYLTPLYCVPYMHVIMSPDEKGVACDVRQHFFTFEVPVCNIPYYPNYRLGTPYPYCNPDIVVVTSTQQTLSPPSAAAYLYPNPTYDMVTISGQNIATVRVIDTQGRLQYMGDGGGQNTHRIDMGTWRAGVYFVQVVLGEDAQVQTLKCLKVE